MTRAEACHLKSRGLCGILVFILPDPLGDHTFGVGGRRIKEHQRCVLLKGFWFGEPLNCQVVPLVVLGTV